MRLSSSIVVSLALIVQGCGSSTSQREPVSSDPPVCEPCPECAAPQQPAVAVPEPDEPPAVVIAGACETSWLPPGLVVTQTDEETNSLVEMVRGWLQQQSRPMLDIGRGTLFAKSEDDQGADPPYPSFALRTAEHACGSQQLWLLEHARHLLAVHASPEMSQGIRCNDNVCCYDSLGEYDSGGTLVFTLDEQRQRWVLRAFAVVADNGGQDWVAEERSYVTTSLARLMRRRRCRGEPQIVW